MSAGLAALKLFCPADMSCIVKSGINLSECHFIFRKCERDAV